MTATVSMQNGQEFVDLYALLQVRSTCDTEMLDKAFRHFAQQYHPDHAETADIGKFQQILDAYRVLKDPEERKKYDAIYRTHRSTSRPEFSFFDDRVVGDETASADADAHEEILYILYKRRREHADDPGVMRHYIQRSVECSEESLEFHIWYLKAKGFIQVSEDSSLIITVEGVDHVISMSRDKEKIRLLSSEVSEPSE